VSLGHIDLIGNKICKKNFRKEVSSKRSCDDREVDEYNININVMEMGPS
jgi:hypothetical protein